MYEIRKLRKYEPEYEPGKVNHFRIFRTFRISYITLGASGFDRNIRLCRPAEGAVDLVNPDSKEIRANLYSKAKTALARAFSPAFGLAFAAA